MSDYHYYRVQTDIPIPPEGGHKKWASIAGLMSPGDSVLVRTEQEAQSLYSAIMARSVYRENVVSRRKVADGYRVWRKR